jgi:hypothetical protein
MPRTKLLKKSKEEISVLVPYLYQMYKRGDCHFLFGASAAKTNFLNIVSKLNQELMQKKN